MSIPFRIELEKLDTEQLPLGDLKAIITAAFLTYTTSDEYIGKAHTDHEYAEKVRETYMTLVQLIGFVKGMD